MPAKETHIATLQQDARSSCYFCCDVHGEERRSRLTTFSGCDIVIASDSVAMIGSPGSVGLATTWLERRKLISLPVSRDWAANDRGGTPREGTATPPRREGPPESLRSVLHLVTKGSPKSDSPNACKPTERAAACRLSLPADGLRIREDRSLEMAGNRLSYGRAALALSAGQ